MLLDIIDCLKMNSSTPTLENKVWDNGLYFKLETDKPASEQLSLQGESFLFVEKNEVVRNKQNKELLRFFYERDHLTKIMNKDSNKTIDHISKTFWSRNIAYIAIKNKRLSSEEKPVDIDYFKKEVFHFFDKPDTYYTRICENGSKSVIPSNSEYTSDEIFRLIAPELSQYLFSAERQKINDFLMTYIENNIDAISSFCKTELNQPLYKDAWVFIALSFDNSLCVNLTELDYYKNESDLYFLVKKFASNEYNIYDKKTNELLGVPNFGYTVNKSKPGLFTSTQKTPVSILCDSEEINDRLSLFDFFNKHKYKFTTMGYDGRVVSKRDHGIVFKFSGDILFLENNPIIQNDSFYFECFHHPFFSCFAYKKYNSKNALLFDIMDFFYNIYRADNTHIYDLSFEKERAKDASKNPLHSLFIRHADQLANYFDKSNERSMQDFINKNAFKCVHEMYRQALLNKDGSLELKAKKSMVLYMNLKRHFTVKGERDIMSELLDKDLAFRENREIPSIHSRDEFMYYAGQLIYFISTKNNSNTKNKHFDIITNNIKTSNINGLKRSMERLFTKYAHKIHTNDKQFKGLFKELLSYEDEHPRMNAHDREKLTLGLMVDNLFFTKKTKDF